MNSIYNYAQKISDQAYHMVWGYELNATSENLEWALQQNKNDILKYKFNDSSHTYTVIEFAVKSGNLSAAQILVELGGELEYSPASGMGNILHFYMDCLDENISPNLDLLNFLISRISDINKEEASYFRTPLECALEKMAQFKKIHWSVVEILLQRGSGIRYNESTGCDPFNILINSRPLKTKNGYLVNNIEEESTFLAHLVEYAKLEEKYHPNSNCSLTLDEFKLHTSNITNRFSWGLTSMSCSSFMSDAISDVLDSLSNELQKADFFQEKQPFSSDEDIKEISDFKESAISCKNDINKSQSLEFRNMAQALISYHRYFRSLVKGGSFKDCFQPSELSSIISAIRMNVGIETAFLLDILNK